MTQLRLYFNSEDLRHIQWYRLDESSILDSGTLTDGEIKPLAHSCQEVIFVVPQQWVYLTKIELQNRQQKQLLSAAAYQLEDQLAEDVELLHFAQGVEAEGSVPFVVIKRDIMQALVGFEQQSGVVAHAIVCEAELIAEVHQSSDVKLYQSQHHELIVGATRENVVCCDDRYTEFYLQHFFKHGLNEPIPKIEAKDWQAQAIDVKNCINLKQKEFSQGYQFQEYINQLKVPLLLLGVFLVAFLVNEQLQNTALQQRFKSLQQQQKQMLAKVLPQKIIGSNPKKALIKVLQAQASAQQEKGFSFIFHEFIKRKQVVPSVSLEKVDYRKGQLTVDLEAKSLQDLDRLAEHLKTVFAVKIEQMNSTALSSQGRFILKVKP